MISIVVPVYNGEKFIEDCIKSILGQTYPDWELILIDNDSEDHTLKICKEYARLDGRIQVFHQHKNRGVSVARNLGLERAAGAYITFIDADDWIEKDYLERLLYLLKKEDGSMVICEYEKVYEKDRLIFRQKNEKEEALPEQNRNLPTAGETVRKFDKEEYLKEYFLEGNTHCWGILFKIGMLEEIHFPKDIAIGEDMLFLLKAAEKAEKIVISDYRGYRYFINENGAMNQKFIHSYMDQITCWERAAKVMESSYPALINKTESIILISILLVVGKLACLGKEERSQYIEEENKCYELFAKYVKKAEVVKYLDSGYKMKAFLYGHFPKLYLFLYGLKR